MLTRPPEPSLEDRATLVVRFERAKLAGFSENRAAALALYLEAPDVVRAAELVEAGCDPHTAGRIVA